MAFKGGAEPTGEHAARETRNDGLERRVPAKVKAELARHEVIFFGNGPLADYALQVLEPHCHILFHARTRADLATVAELKKSHPAAHGVLASFGVLIKSDLLELFEPEGILNLHPSKLPLYRGASPIESAILAGDTDFSYSIMKLVAAMDAGPLYHQATLTNLPLDKTTIYCKLATAGAEWLVDNIDHLPSPIPQNDAQATFTTKLDKSMSELDPERYTAAEILRQIVAFQGFPKPKYQFFGKTCIILQAHLAKLTNGQKTLSIICRDGQAIIVDRLQPEGKKPMDARSFLNGYAK